MEPNDNIASDAVPHILDAQHPAVPIYPAQYSLYNVYATNTSGPAYDRLYSPIAYATSTGGGYYEVNRLKNDIEELSRELRELKETISTKQTEHVEPENFRKIKV
jgi:hypothetical protein